MKGINNILAALALLLPVIMSATPGRAGDYGQDNFLQARIVLMVEDESLLSSQLDGRIEKIMVREGERFKNGDTLVTMDCAIHRARKKRVEADLSAASFNLQAQKKLMQLRTGSGIKLKAAESELARVQADLLIVQTRIDMCRITAPFSGLVVKRHAHMRQYLAKGEPILEIIDDSTMTARLIVPSNWLLWLRKGDEFSFRLDETGNLYRATVARIGVRIDPASQTVPITGTIHGSHPELRVGMGGEASFAKPGDKTP